MIQRLVLQSVQANKKTKWETITKFYVKWVTVEFKGWCRIIKLQLTREWSERIAVWNPSIAVGAARWWVTGLMREMSSISFVWRLVRCLRRRRSEICSWKTDRTCNLAQSWVREIRDNRVGNLFYNRREKRARGYMMWVCNKSLYLGLQCILSNKKKAGKKGIWFSAACSIQSSQFTGFSILKLWRLGIWYGQSWEGRYGHWSQLVGYRHEIGRWEDIFLMSGL